MTSPRPFPVTQSVNQTFAYLMRERWSLLRALAAPALFYVALMTVIMPRHSANAVAVLELSEDANAQVAGEVVTALLISSGAAGLAGVVAYAMMFAAALQPLVRGKAPAMRLGLRFGRDETRLAGAMLAAGIAAFLGAAALTTLLVALAGALPGGAGRTAAALGPALAILVMFGFALRLSLVLPAAIDTGSFGLKASWRLTRQVGPGYVFFWLVIAIVLMAVSVAQGSLTGPGELPAETPANAGSREQMMAIQIAAVKAAGAAWDPSRPSFLLHAPVNLAAILLSTAIGAAAQGVAYLQLKGRA